jgi:hypothetical protein
MKENQDSKISYLQEIDEALRELNAAYAQYANIEFFINLKNMDAQDKQAFRNTINNIRIYETHAYIRIKTLKPKMEETYPELVELRKHLKKTVPEPKDVEKLVLQYNKIKSEQFPNTSFLEKL